MNEVIETFEKDVTNKPELRDRVRKLLCYDRTVVEESMAITIAS